MSTTHSPHIVEPVLGYTVTERIGAGGYGEVWRADAPGGLKKAIKFVYGCLDEDRASRELKALNRIKEVRHPFLLSLERIEIIDGRLLIITELADRSLKDRFDECRAAGLCGIPREELLLYMRDAADALDYMSEKHSLQHLDIKPENILLMSDRVKVADFGLVKDIHDHTASMMGGLTPVYAAPEVFDERPSLHSDQYSLAIVYQEMLTNVLPFPGRTAAQLARQHLQSKPRITPLPPADRPVIERSLAKQPNERFASCREMVDALAAPPEARRATAAPIVVPSPAPEAEPEFETPVSDSAHTQNCKIADIRAAAGLDEDQATMPRAKGAPSAQPVTPSVARAPSIGRSPTPVAKSSLTPAPRGAPVVKLTGPRPATDVIDLPPLDVDADAAKLRPTLFLGVGGAGGTIMKALRRRLAQRFESVDALSAFQFLLVDTDQKALNASAQSDDEDCLRASETLYVPLRRPEDYRADSTRLLRWLSRRWIYNIPRSLQTEGLRPLGRLALVDHLPQLETRLRTAFDAMTAREAVAELAHRTGEKVEPDLLRVFVFGSISGGTASGMLLDLAYVVRKSLQEHGHSDQGLCGVLVHSTSRRSTDHQVAIANAHACLSELYRYGMTSGYPGDDACGLPSHVGQTFPNTYVIHMGDDLDDDQFVAATDSVAEYLALSTLAASGSLLERCRANQSLPHVLDDSGPRVRTFGLCQLGAAHGEFPARAGDVLCRRVVSSWLGVRCDDESGGAAPPGAGLAMGNRMAIINEVDNRSKQLVAELGLDGNKLVDRIYGIVRAEVNADYESYVRGMVHTALSRDSGELAARISATVVEVQRRIGTYEAESDSEPQPTDTLREKLETQVQKVAAGLGRQLHDFVAGLVDDPKARLTGAERAAQWLLQHQRSLSTQTSETLARLRQERQQFLEAFRRVQPAAQGRLRRYIGSAADVPPETEEQLVQFAREQFHEVVFAAVAKIASATSAPVVAARDALQDTRRELNRLLGQFPPCDLVEPADAGEDATASENGGGEDPSRLNPAETVQRAVVRCVSDRLPDLTDAVDQEFQASVLSERGGLAQLVRLWGDSRAELPRMLRHVARTAVMGALREVEVADQIVPNDGHETLATEELAVFLGATQPRLVSCGGSRRLLLVTPHGDGDARLASAAAHCAGCEPAMVPHDSSDVVLCYEMGDVPLVNVADAVVASSPDCAELSKRLHTRMDVDWISIGP